LQKFTAVPTNWGKRDFYAVPSYPKPDFQNEPDMQRVVTLRRKTRDTGLLLGFIVWFAVFFGTLLLAIIADPIFSLAGLGLLLVLFVLLAFFGGHDPALDCPRCGKQLENDFALLESEEHGVFMICPVCQIYVYTHRTFRRVDNRTILWE
jgi:hypothetical protein